MKVHIFGTCSGTAPVAGRHHVSFAVEHNEGLYWFDAGEGCSYTAHTMRVNIMATQAVFISHTHMDHIGGLGNLFWTIRKLDTVRHVMKGREIKLFIPDMRAWNALHQLLLCTQGGFNCDFSINAGEFDDSMIFSQDGLTVEALHNSHLPRADRWLSYSFRIKAEEKSLVYSGDVGSVTEVFPLLDSCDLFLMETGHHRAAEVAQALIDNNLVPKRLAFIHHGRDILKDLEGELESVTRLLGNRVCILDDATTLTM